MLLLVAGMVLGYGGWRLADAHGTGSRQVVALAAIDSDENLVEPNSLAGRALMDTYSAAVAAQVAAGADVIVLPEKVFIVDGDHLTDQLGPLVRIARDHDVVIVVGTGVRESGTTYKSAVALSTVQQPAIYLKQHLVPGLENDLTPGDQLAVVRHDGEQWGLAVCKDLDFPSLIRQYGTRNVDMLLVPAWDFTDDAWLHSRMAVARGVENGFPVARAARAGVLTVSDRQGRVLAESRTTPGAAPTTVRIDLGIDSGETLYARTGDWFPWAGILLLVLVLILRRRWSGRKADDGAPTTAF